MMRPDILKQDECGSSSASQSTLVELIFANHTSCASEHPRGSAVFVSRPRPAIRWATLSLIMSNGATATSASRFFRLILQTARQ